MKIKLRFTQTKSGLLLALGLFSNLGWGQTTFNAIYTFSSDVSSLNYNGTVYLGITPNAIIKTGITSSTSNNNYRGTNWPTGATSGSDAFTGSVDTGKYIGFTISAKVGCRFTISSITFGIGRSGTGTRQSQWRGSVDSYTTVLDNYSNLPSGLTNNSGILTNLDSNSSWTGTVLTLGTNFENITTSAGLRYYLYNTESTIGTAGLQGVLTITGTFEILNTTWDGTTWSNGTPTATIDAIINGNYSTTANGVFTAKTLTVNASKSFTINSENSITVAGAVTNNGSFVVQNNANLVQTNTAAVTNTGNIIVNRNSATIQLYDYTLWSSPVSGQLLQGFSPNTLANRFYTYDSTAGTSGLYSVVSAPSTTNFAAANGYLIRAPNTWTAAAPTTFNGVFTGVPNNGTVPITLNYTDASHAFNLVGNPYPSTIDAQAFITENTTTIESTLYFWRKTNGGQGSSYAAYNPAGGTATYASPTSEVPNGTIQVGQGFFVQAKSASTLNFKNAMRLASTSTQFFRSNTDVERNRIWINITSTLGVFSQMLVSYMTDATQGVDFLDGRYINDAPTALTSIINAEEYTIQGRALPFTTTDTLPLGFKTDVAGNYTIAIDHVDGLFSSGQTIYLKDNLLNSVTDLSAGSYSFASAIGTFNSRFEVVYQSALGVNHPTFSSNSVMAFSENGAIKINTGSDIMAHVEVYDLQGRLLVEKKQINTTETKITSTVINQIVLVQISNSNGAVVTKKIRL
jgi:hypothetical protein